MWITQACNLEITPKIMATLESANGNMSGHATTCHQVERDQVMPTATSVQSISQ